MVAGDAVFGAWGVDVFGWLYGEHLIIPILGYFVLLFVAFFGGLVNMLYCMGVLLVGVGYFGKIFW